jgi:ssRNA-specific RNase YbeY (16S rRNA maturation enzyme)
MSHETRARDARRLGLDERHLSMRIVVHGLHVVGYDHESDADAARMERRNGRYCCVAGERRERVVLTAEAAALASRIGRKQNVYGQ